jgi:hypothetical protein
LEQLQVRKFMSAEFYRPRATFTTVHPPTGPRIFTPASYQPAEIPFRARRPRSSARFLASNEPNHGAAHINPITIIIGTSMSSLPRGRLARPRHTTPLSAPHGRPVIHLHGIFEQASRPPVPIVE